MTLTRDLALRIERIVPRGDLLEAERRPDRLTVARFGGTIVARSEAGRPRANVYCFSQADLDQLPAILDFFAGRSPRFFLSPVGFSAEVATALLAAGLQPSAFDQAILYGSPPPAPPLPPGITIERVTPATLDDSVQTSAAGWEWPAAWRNAATADLRASFTESSHWYLARVAGVPAGVASIALDDDGVARLGGSAVIPSHRGRGCHRALIAHRLQVALDHGCELVVGSASYGSTSFQNQQRAGLRLVYVENEWGRVGQD